MLALKTETVTFVIIFATTMASLVNGQQPQQPSQRFQPVPPSVHIPPQDVERVQLRRAIDQAKNSMAPNQRQLTSPQIGYTFSDQQGRLPQYEPGTIQQTSYSTPDDDGPQVPEILAGPSPNQFQAPVTSGPDSIADAVGTQPFTPPNGNDVPAEATTTEMVQHAQHNSPRVDPQAIANQQDFVNQQMERIRQRAAQQAAELQQSAAKTETQPANPTEADQYTASPHAPAADQLTEEQNPEMEEAFVDESVAASEPESTTPVETSQPHQSATDMLLTAKPVEVAQRIVDLDHPSSLQNATPQIRQASVETMPSAGSTSMPPEISLSSPGIEVQSFGPHSIGINKTSTYKIIATNRGRTDANQIVVGINLPHWVDIANTNLTNGQKEITDGNNQSRLVWTIDRIPANSTQTLTIDCVPRKAEMFDLGVEWTLAPRVGAAHVEVTEPRLEMKIAGPHDVLYGEKAIYHVTVRNPGTGTAENVNVMLPEALGGERASLGEIPPGREKNFQVELLARTAGQLDLTATAMADGDLNTTATRQIDVRRANLGVVIEGPGMKYAGTVGQYKITIDNTGDATAQEVVAAIALPTGVKYVGGVEGANEIEGGLRWLVGSLDSGDKRIYNISCELNASGDLQLEAGARGTGDLAASAACMTTVETVADLVLSVEDPKGPLPTGQNVVYQLHVKNRGSRAAQNVQLVMQFSDGIEPVDATGLKHQIVPGQVLFSPISQINPDEEMTFQVTAMAHSADTHVFRAQLTCADSDSREIAEGTTRFFGESVQAPSQQQTDVNTAGAESEFEPNEINR